jgi:hypothetical protein
LELAQLGVRAEVAQPVEEPLALLDQILKVTAQADGVGVVAALERLAGHLP